MPSKSNYCFCKCLGLLILLGINQVVIASDIQVPIQNMINFSTAASTAVFAAEANITCYSIAELTVLNQKQKIMGEAFILPQTALQITSTLPFMRIPLSLNTGNIRSYENVSVFHDASKVNDQWVFGFGMIVSDGSRKNYQDTPIVRYVNTRSELRMVDLASNLDQYDKQWQLKLGISHDKTHTPDHSRNIFSIEKDESIPAFDAQYKIAKNLTLDFGYAHVFYKKAKNINEPAPLAVEVTQGLQNIQNAMKSRNEAIGFQLKWDIKP